MIQRRQERLAQEAELMEGGANRCREPFLWDVWAVPGSEKWEEMMVWIIFKNRDTPLTALTQPLSVELRGTSTSSPAPDRHGSFTSAEHLLYMYRGLGRLPFASPSYSTPPREVPITSQGSRTPKAEGPLELQIAVLVAMPSPASPTRDRAWAMNGKRASVDGQEHRLGMDEMSDTAVGITMIPWDKERMDFG